MNPNPDTESSGHPLCPPVSGLLTKRSPVGVQRVPVGRRCWVLLAGSVRGTPHQGNDARQAACGRWEPPGAFKTIISHPGQQPHKYK